MSCSKIFSGDLPELTYEVIKYFQNDYSTLYSCILVNRLWCRLTIPLLWENPFSICTENNDFIEIYLCNLNNDFITILNEYKIFNNSLSTNTLFNYPSFLKYLNTYKFITSIDKWVDYVIRNSTFEISYLFKHFDSVSKLIFKIFIENEIKLHTLEIEISGTYYSTYFNEILELILQNQNFIHNIGNLKLYIKNYDENMDHILQITHLHQNLKKILICNNYTSLYQSLLLSKDYNCSNTLNTITFYYVDFRKIINLDKVFGQLNVLETVHIINCSSLEQIINLSKPFKLKSLILIKIQFESLQQLLLKSGDYLENFGLGFSYGLSSRQVLLGLIIKYCKNIKFLDLCEICEFRYQITYEILDLIENIKQALNHLSINILEDNHSTNDSSIILKNLGQALPSKLEYLSLELKVKESDFRAFLENSQDVFINKLLIKLQIGSDDISHYIKEYIMKGERVKYLAIMDINNNNQLSDFRDEVVEFKLYNIGVRSYNDLLISVDKFIKNID
ncbi:uncharacterized protein OCT59_008510 [Rhizophagus irregularis]|uniref:F-box domain-containing protein n=2 Tax=Rhizophagus irregularis TaxID=588596 RepID=A0A015MA47_RHIIW|nr:hypothetical protein GLOIN_2v1782939 [Rhizophagus irregularis DAOM 181602=DAOM 197198]EXX63703.1 hypothetical protein RirG_149880 [Rhizophagus irregularis DAOM 197198w]POG64427.1 hypothetical protein GLOIN_2v1782939 [Rhizophagus irregularis DAOM 181602=DAOM 197198]UZO17149.1 hypothetical protein OCT59_008510 [Rhizophagus irregularis]GET60678.1 hypothetical protein GLOIN_2v1782939 [Rhizophagus irregularis DAOM 181602=DAOM 197198]|eukprot:XP_025171293.1 hypothetical protein GLOIN_2v1782939 [Rhizophagus irregularis DAOM 181602=DAOM 197198]